jgi:hypothetical protein
MSMLLNSVPANVLESSCMVNRKKIPPHKHTCKLSYIFNCHLSLLVDNNY